MIIHNFDPVLIDLGFLQIKWYSIAYILGITLGWLYSLKIIRNNDHLSKDITQSDFDDLITYLVIGIILGGRLGYVIFYNLNYYSDNIIEIFKLWHGGMSFHGGLCGVIFSTYIFAKIKKKQFFKLTDIISCVAPIGIFFGRIANFINGELVGKESSVAWAVIFTEYGNLARHPSQIYEAFLEGVLLFVIINFLALKKDLIFKSGIISGIFLILYSFLRIISEYFRAPDEHIGYIYNYFSMGVILSIFTLLVGLVITILIKKNEQNN
jgi:phosphatidylglycerol---prolipoprotein diacylglyceryl transferase